MMNPKTMLPIADLATELSRPRKIFITTHYKPDGDAIGSLLGLKLYLEKKGHHVVGVSPCEVPDFLIWMPGLERILNYEAQLNKSLRALEEAEFIFCVDLNSLDRTKTMTEVLQAAKQPTVIIDHHLLPAAEWDYGVSNPGKSSTCEMVYDYIIGNGDDALIDQNIAGCLYTGIVTDTGSFRFPATAAGTHLTAARLLQTGIDHSRIHEAVSDSWSLKRMQFLGFVLLDRMEIFHEYRTGLITISKADIKNFGVNVGDTEGLVNYPMSIKDVDFSVMMTERSDEVKLSLRSQGSYDVSEVARTYFKGGGHFNASGGRLEGPFSESIAYFKSILPDIRTRYSTASNR
jgi:phosphoesterase RecJ-like protein